MTDTSATTALRGQDRRISTGFIGVGAALGVLFAVGFVVVGASVPAPVSYGIDATDGWMMGLLFVGLPAVVAYSNDGLATCWLFAFCVLLPVYLAWPTTWIDGDVAYRMTVAERVGIPLYVAILSGTFAFFLGVGARWVVRTLFFDTSPDMKGVSMLMIGQNRRRTVATSLGGIVPGIVVALAYGWDVPLLGRLPLGPEQQTLHLVLVGAAVLLAAVAAFANDGIVPAWLLAVGFFAIVYGFSYAHTYGWGQAVFSGFLTGVTFGSVGSLLGIVFRWVISSKRFPSVGGEPSV